MATFGEILAGLGTKYELRVGESNPPTFAGAPQIADEDQIGNNTLYLYEENESKYVGGKPPEDNYNLYFCFGNTVKLIDNLFDVIDNYDNGKKLAQRLEALTNKDVDPTSPNPNGKYVYDIKTTQVGGGGTGTSYDDTEIWNAIKENQTTYETSGTNNVTYTLTIPNVTDYSQLVDKKIFVKFHITNSGTTVNLNVNGLGNKSITRNGVQQPLPSMIIGNSVWIIEYNGTTFVLVGAYYQPIVSQSDAETGTLTGERAWSPLRVKQAIEALAPSLPPTYGTCSTVATTVAKEVTLPGFTLDTGVNIRVKFTNANTATNPTLNINQTGAKSLFYNGGLNGTSSVVPGQIIAGFIANLVYDGTNWVLMNPMEIIATNQTNATTSSSSNPNKAIWYSE